MKPQRGYSIYPLLIQLMVLGLICAVLGGIGGYSVGIGKTAERCLQQGHFVNNGVIFKCAPIKPAKYDGERYRNIV